MAAKSKRGVCPTPGGCRMKPISVYTPDVSRSELRARKLNRVTIVFPERLVKKYPDGTFGVTMSEDDLDIFKAIAVKLRRKSEAKK